MKQMGIFTGGFYSYFIRPLCITCILAVGSHGDTLFGGERTLIQVGGKTGFVVRPPHAFSNGSKPWVWYAPTFINNYPDEANGWYFDSLISKGFWLFGVDVGESYGSHAGRQVYSAFYDTIMARYHLNPKGCLVPQSRGGLMAYNWAEDIGNTEKVSRIAGIYPVCDPASYPGLTTAAAAYGLTVDSLRAHIAEYTPFDRLASLYEAGVKIMHIHGDADNIVPLSANSQVLYDRYTALDGDMTLIVKHGLGHAEFNEFLRDPQMLAFMMADSLISPTATINRGSNAPSGRLHVGYANTAIRYRIDGGQSADLSLCDLSGRFLIKTRVHGEGMCTWNTGVWSHGIYLCRLSMGGKTMTMSVVSE
jgi:hypothetical protein